MKTTDLARARNLALRVPNPNPALRPCWWAPLLVGLLVSWGCDQAIVLGHSPTPSPAADLGPWSELRFRLEASYEVSAGPLAVGDLDRDGWPDAILASAEGVHVLLGRGDGTLAMAAPLAAGPRPAGIALGDLDGDGALDVVIADREEERVSMLRGDGRGGLLPRASFSAGARPGDIALLDLDRDRMLDVVVAGDRATTGLRGLGGGGLGAPALYTGCAEGVTVRSGDLRGVGGVDVLVGCRDGGIQLLSASGGGLQDGARHQLPENDLAAALLVDLSGDGLPDLVLVGARSAVAQVYRNSGGQLLINEKFSERYPVGAGPLALLTADFDGDGVPDIASAGSQAESVSILPGAAVRRGDMVGARHFSVGGVPVSVAAADLDRDGRVDLLVARKAGGLAVLRNVSR